MTPSRACKLILWIGLLLLVVGGCGEEQESFTQVAPKVIRKKVTPKKVVRQVAPSPEAAKPLEAKVEPSQPETEAATPEEAKMPEEGKKELAYNYDPKGKPDPFLPPSSRLKASELPKKRVRKHRLPLTPLQKVSLSQLKLVGVIVSPSGNKALVEEPSGKGYVIGRGTYVGQNFGRVKRILPDRVVVEEEVEDFFTGEMKRQTSELIIQKEFGEI
ncbi:MAG: pilus assembly protein PilP [Deltaproteobacteria bacterium]|nr:pilus assembly protein PilP [Deltaproteobacteria bacterium]